MTSQDINNTAVPLSIKEAISTVYNPEINEIIELLDEKTKEYDNLPMLARTHGLTASPTRLGKEFDVFKTRIIEQLNFLVYSICIKVQVLQVISMLTKLHFQT